MGRTETISPISRKWGRWLEAAVAVSALALASARAADAQTSPVRDLAGTFKVEGTDSVRGGYRGEATLTKRSSYTYRVSVSLDFPSGGTRVYSGTAWVGRTKLYLYYNLGGGIAGAVAGDRPASVRAVWTPVSKDKITGEWKASDGRTGTETLDRKVAPLLVDLRVDSNNDGAVTDADDAVEEEKAKSVGVNDDDDGAPAGPDSGNAVIDGDDDLGDLTRLEVKVDGARGTLTLAASPKGRVRIFDNWKREVLAPAADKADLDAFQFQTSRTFYIEGVAPGEATISLTPSEDPAKADRVKVKVTGEKVYLFLMGYQGEEETYLAADVEKLYTIVKDLERRGYKVYDDGMSFDQSKLDAAFTASNLAANPRIAIVDRNVTQAQLRAYFARGTVRGVFWGSHGYMAPFIGCPDDELSVFESRVWTAPPGKPAETEVRNWVREWKALMKTQLYLPLDFAILHSCATGGLGTDYWEKPWDYTDPETKARAERKFGTLPKSEKLTFRTFDLLDPEVIHLITYNGSSYFGLHDLNIGVVIRNVRDGGAR